MLSRSSSRHIVQTPHSAGHAGHICRAVLAGAALLVSSVSTQAVPWVVQVRSAAGAPIADAVVAVQINGQATKASAQTTAQMAQRARQFDPYVLVVQTGTAVSFPNFDTVRHHVYSFSATKTFDIKLYAGTPANPVVFDSAGVATLGCNIHDRMSAHVVVVDTPLFTKSSASGAATFDLPAGNHVLLFWHARLGSTTLQSKPLRVDNDAGRSELTLVGID
jgi:plastocyanin